MESAVLIYPALEFFLTVLPLAPDCATTDQKSAPHIALRLGQTFGANRGAVWGKAMRRVGALHKSINFY